ncbi:MAG: DNA repair protein RecO [Candidatus Jacksonbacteria bacterium RIFCSPLOWO2_02_FULL_43_9]|nr:MAG: repair protein RecO protein [Parcubacteria group bacterium GW2011_GWA2_43_13]OGY69240.1 MAG: DNA repair protein RecO [Candidatus Jacksonbacteria bacterium RIFCSPHIGHO2_02_FULL_43_10]OGY70393.1 MAG: DNA repair protein RecO [Candidatus Jacksonbacteria bacterium RIFCSPLOWO2_01_FULL_44_13]OGY73713.1 MAG: DNA repair protein RecO [Candidatus Jacksonbacteria bacterium RIFCSPLOWO2_02_FULL_43_9]HAZ16586.1 DNA repair protein RecO [Candidatus Jacksonbacteria bacterium]
MSTYITEGIVLKYYPYRDFDRIFTIYTKEHGKIDVIGKGTGKLLSKLAGHLEPYTVSKLMVADGRRWDVLTQSITLDAFSTLKTTLSGLACAGVIAEAVDLLTKSGFEDYAVYTHIHQAFDALNNDSDHPPMLIYHVIWKLMALLGFAPHVTACVRCKTELSGAQAQASFFHFIEAGFVCNECMKEGVSAVMWPTSREGLETLHFLMTAPLAIWRKRDTLSPEDRGIARLILHYYQYCLGDAVIPRSILFHRAVFSPVVH